jgi:hypothetical protein
VALGEGGVYDVGLPIIVNEQTFIPVILINQRNVMIYDGEGTSRVGGGGHTVVGV